MDKLISIIVPVYNVEAYIERCLDSLRAQTYKNIEVILVDDGSTDKSGEICDRYAEQDERFKVFHRENGGVCAARNTALSHVTGEYIGFADPDDECSPDMFEYLMRGAEQYGAGITCCRYYRVIPGKNTKARCDGRTYIYDKDEAMAELVNNFIIRNVFWNKLFRRDIFDGVVFPEGRIYEGTAMIYKLIEKTDKLVSLGDPKYYYYSNEGSYIYTKTFKNALDYAWAHITRYNDMAEKYPQLEKKLIKDLVPPLLELKKFRSVSPQEAEDNRADIELIRSFCDAHKEQIRKEIYKQTGYCGETVSVIVPVYNVQAYLRKCLDSLLGQTYTDLEIILVDDGSTDLGGRICDEYAEKDPRVKVIHQKNKGLCGARNAGMKAATGAYIGFVDSDDWLKNDMYDYLVRKLEGYKADIVSCRYYRVTKGKDTASRCDGEDVILNQKEAIRELVNRFVLRSTFWNKLFRREVFDGFEFPEGRTYEGTVSMHKVFEKAEKIVLLGDPKYYYVDNEGSIINTKSVRNGVNYALSYIDRYNYLVGDYPDLRFKMMSDAVSAIRKLRYVCLGATQEQLDEFRNEFEQIRKFMLENKEYVFDEIMTTKRLRREYNYLSRITPKGFKKAHDIAGAGEFIDKFFGKFSRKKKKKKGGAKKKKGGGEIAPEMTPEKAATLRRLQLVLVQILDVVDDICRRHGLKYFLYGGTLLGAVRNKGIIPWDDDMDIVMFRDDYDKFAEICKTELPEGYFYQTSLTDPEYPNIAAKIRKDGTYVREKKWDDKELHKGIFIDILPLDHFPKNKLLTKVYLHIASFLHQVCAFKYCHSSNIVVRVLFRLAKLLPRKFWYRRRENFLRFCNRHGDSELVCSFGSHYQPMTKRILRSEWFGNGTELEMEGKMYMAPEKWEGYLLHLFGKSYMQLPPEDQRICHSDLDAIRFDTCVADEIENAKKGDSNEKI